MKAVDITGEAREGIGSAEARRLRRRGRLPCVIYGLDRPTLTFSLDMHDFAHHFHHGHRVFRLRMDDRRQLCLLKDIQLDAFGESLLHADFSRVDESQKVEVTVPLEFVGEPDPVAGAVIEFPISDLAVRCTPGDIPEKVEVPVASLEVGDHVDASQVALPEGVELMGSPDQVLAVFHYKHVSLEPEEEEEAEVPEEGEEGAEPEVLTERKPEGEGD